MPHLRYVCFNRLILLAPESEEGNEKNTTILSDLILCTARFLFNRALSFIFGALTFFFYAENPFFVTLLVLCFSSVLQLFLSKLWEIQLVFCDYP